MFKDTCNTFANTLASKYPKFQKDKFLLACGVEKKDNIKLCYQCES